MSIQALACPRCGRVLREGALELSALDCCPRCLVPLRVTVFPAYGWVAGSVTAGQRLIVEGESSCFFHASRRAVVPCDHCGRLVCSLCDLEVGGVHVCPECLPSLDQRGSLEVLERQRTRHDSIVWTMLFVGLVFFFVLAPLCGLAALGWTIWHWRSPPSRIVRTRWRLALAILVALAEVVGGIGLWVAFFGGGWA